MSSSSSRPFPLETHAAILRYCDVPTLAVSSRVCLAWLELIGPILYEHITIKGRDTLEMMIRSEQSLIPSIAAFVSLDQTSTFTYAPFAAHNASIDVSKRLSAYVVPVEKLVIDLRGPPTEGSAFRSTGRSSFELDNLFFSFSPQHVHLLDLPSTDSRMACLIDYPLADPDDPEWPDLLEVTFTHAFFGGADLVELPLADRSPPLKLVYDISTPPAQRDDLGRTLDCIQEDLARHRRPMDQPAFGHVQVWVHNEGEVEAAREMLFDLSCTSLDIGVKPSTAA